MMTPRLLTLGSETRSMKAWARYLQIPYKRIESRLRRGLGEAEALSRENFHDARRARTSRGRLMVRRGMSTERICELLGCGRGAVDYYRSLEAGKPARAHRRAA